MDPTSTNYDLRLLMMDGDDEDGTGADWEELFGSSDVSFDVGDGASAGDPVASASGTPSESVDANKEEGKQVSSMGRLR